jgi:hypothetical protein
MTRNARTRPLARRLTLIGTGLALVGALAQPGAARQESFPGGSGQIAFTRSGVLYTVNPNGSGARTTPQPCHQAWIGRSRRQHLLFCRDFQSG